MNALRRPLGGAGQPSARHRRSAGRSSIKVFNGRVLKFIGETIRQAGILIIGSAVIVLGLVFILGLAVRDRGRLRGAVRSARRLATGRDHRALRPARGDSVRLRLHDGRQGRHRIRRRDRVDADLRRDRRARGDGLRLDPLPRLDAAAGHLDRAAVPVHAAPSRSASSPRTSRPWSSSVRCPPAATYSSSGSSRAHRLPLLASSRRIAMATFIVLVCIYYGYNVSRRPGRRRARRPPSRWSRTSSAST